MLAKWHSGHSAAVLLLALAVWGFVQSEPSEEPVAYYTKLLVFVGVAQAVIFGITLVGVIRSANAAKETAEIASTSMRVLERAYIVPGFPKPIAPDAEHWSVDVTLTNIGRSFGTVKELVVKFDESDPLPQTPIYDGAQRKTTSTVLSAHQGPWPGLSPFTSHSTKEGQFCYGYILYEDIFGRTWKNRFSVQIWRAPAPGIHHYHPAGSVAYHEETEQA